MIRGSSREPTHVHASFKNRFALEPTATLAMAAKAKELTAAGKKVYDFSVGEPDFTTPSSIFARPPRPP